MLQLAGSQEGNPQERWPPTTAHKYLTTLKSKVGTIQKKLHTKSPSQGEFGLFRAFRVLSRAGGWPPRTVQNKSQSGRSRRAEDSDTGMGLSSNAASTLRPLGHGHRNRNMRVVGGAGRKHTWCTSEGKLGISPLACGCIDVVDFCQETSHASLSRPHQLPAQLHTTTKPALP